MIGMVWFIIEYGFFNKKQHNIEDIFELDDWGKFYLLKDSTTWKQQQQQQQQHIYKKHSKEHTLLRFKGV